MNVFRVAAAGLVLSSANSMIALATEGSAVFTQNCLMCHQAAGVGLAGQFPRLAGRVSVISSRPAGRTYLIDVLTYGMAGTVTIDGDTIFGLMPPFAQLSDEDVAAVLGYVQGLGDAPAKNPASFGADEIRKGRAGPHKSAADVRSERQALEAAKLIP